MPSIPDSEQEVISAFIYLKHVKYMSTRDYLKKNNASKKDVKDLIKRIKKIDDHKSAYLISILEPYVKA